MVVEFLDHHDPKCPFFVGWETILDKYSKSMPTSFTRYYFFEFDEGIVSMKHLVDSPESEQICVSLILPGIIGFVGLALLKDLFDVSSITSLIIESMNSLQLPRHPRFPLT